MSGNSPLISVLVPCWNAAASIERALASVLEERTIPLECVVVDDGSTDGTPEIVRALAARDPRVVLIESPTNEGVSAARNHGLRHARGEWLTFLDADDRLLPGAIEALVAPIRQDAPLAVIGQRVWSDGRSRWVSHFYDIPDIRVPGRCSVAARPGLLYYASATGKLIHRSCWDGLTFYGRVLGDQPWTIRALLRAGDRIDVIGDVVYEWRRPPPGTVATSITSVTRSNVASGVEAAAVAERALRDVVEEAHVRLPPDEARAVSERYAERLLRSDLAMHLARALARRDPGVEDLIREIHAFIDRAPVGPPAGSTAISTDVLERCLLAWSKLPPGARAATRQLLATAAAADPGVAERASLVTARFTLGQLLAGGRWTRLGLAAVAVEGLGRRLLRALLRRVRALRGRGRATPANA